MNAGKEALQLGESAVQKSCMDMLDILRVFHWRNNTGALKDHTGRMVRYGHTGSADILGVCPDGRILCVECKRTSGGKVSGAQAEFISTVNRLGGVAIVANSAESMLQQLKERKVIK